MKIISTKGLALFGVAAAVSLTGCTSLFPDKQKKYQYSSEIPPLEIPPDLSASTIEGIGRRDDSAGSEATAVENASTPPSSGLDSGYARSPAGEGAGAAPGTPTLAQNIDNVPIIEIDAPFDTAWLEVSKALGRMELEVSDQNRGDGLFFVYYGGDQKPKEDKGFFGDMAEMFGGGGGSSSKEFRVKLEARQNNTVVYILDGENKPQVDGTGLDLLKQLNQALSTLPAPKDKPES